MSATALFVLHQGALGDLVCIFPILKMLRRRFRPVTILCQGQLGKLAQAEGLVDGCLAIEAAWTASLFAGESDAEARRILAPYSQILVFSRSEVFVASLRHIGGAGLCRVPPRPPNDRRIQMAQHALEHILECGLLPRADAGASMEIHLPAFAPQRGGCESILIHPGAGSRRKRWPLSGFLELAARIADRQIKVAFVIGPAELDLLPELEGHGASIHRPADHLNLAALLRSCTAFVGNDSGVSHLAAWVGLPCVVIFGPSDPLRWRPWGRSVEIVHPPLDCRPCFETMSANCDGGDCLARITVQDVAEALNRTAPIGPIPHSGFSRPPK